MKSHAKLVECQGKLAIVYTLIVKTPGVAWKSFKAAVSRHLAKTTCYEAQASKQTFLCSRIFASPFTQLKISSLKTCSMASRSIPTNFFEAATLSQPQKKATKSATRLWYFTATEIVWKSQTISRWFFSKKARKAEKTPNHWVIDADLAFKITL